MSEDKFEKLLDAIGKVDDQFVSEAAPLNKNRISVFKIGLVAASFAVVILAGVILRGIVGGDTEEKDSITVTRAPIRAPGPGNTYEDNKTSDFESLDELLEYLGVSEGHISYLEGEDYQDINSSGIGEVTDHTMYKNYIYRVMDDKVNIMDMNNMDLGWEVVLECDAKYVCVVENRLAVIDIYVVGDNFTGDPYYKVKIFDIENPKEPVEICEYTQKGRKVAFYTAGNDLYVMTGDGECCCGYTRGDNADSYKAEITFEGVKIEVQDEDVSILGTPTRLQYMTITKIDMTDCSEIENKVIYGDIANVYYEEGAIMVETGGLAKDAYYSPNIYIFDSGDGMKFKRVINVAAEIGVGEKIEYSDSDKFLKETLKVISVAKNKSLYQIAVQFTYVVDETRNSMIGGVVYDETTQNVKCALESGNNVILAQVDDIFWDGSNMICCVGIFKSLENVFVRMDFETMEIVVDELRLEMVNGVDGIYGYGNPLGELKTLIPMGEGIYLRYNSVPNGFDIFDLSGEKVEMIFDSKPKENSTPGEIRYDFTWKKYSDDIIGVEAVVPNGDDYWNGNGLWNIYKVDVKSDAPLKLLASYSTDRQAKIYTIEYDGKHYLMISNKEMLVELG